MKKQKTIIVDSSSAILLVKSDAFDHLINSYKIIFPNSVYDELTRDHYFGAKTFQDYARNGKVALYEVDISNKSNYVGDQKINALGIGEKEVIQLYESGIGDFILIDDKKGATYCRHKNIPYINSILLLKILFLSGSISKEIYDESNAKLVTVGRYSDEIIEYVCNCSHGEIKNFLSN
ncbi:hypothetical protein ACFL20_08550 [Spirochaetota bacterium]